MDIWRWDREFFFGWADPFEFFFRWTKYSVNLDAEHWNLEFFGWTKNVVWVNPKNSRFQCEASRWTEYEWTGKQLKRICEHEKKFPVEPPNVQREKWTSNKKWRKKWKPASPKASPFTKYHKTFHYPERDKIQFSYPIEGPKCGCLRKNSFSPTNVLQTDHLPSTSTDCHDIKIWKICVFFAIVLSILVTPLFVPKKLTSAG